MLGKPFRSLPLLALCVALCSPFKAVRGDQTKSERFTFPRGRSRLRENLASRISDEVCDGARERVKKGGASLNTDGSIHDDDEDHKQKMICLGNLQTRQPWRLSVNFKVVMKERDTDRQTKKKEGEMTGK